ncbi:MAG: hypothetical protein IJ802_04255 [Kiritimatiellae bacterium]|nr:hypothetical protein [Kiritimatiellia bacterium]
MKNDGDDISSPVRVERIVAEWVAHGKKHDAVVSDAWKIDADGRRCGRLGKNIVTWIPIGCACAYTARISKVFAEPRHCGVVDDAVWGNRLRLMRAMGCGGEVLHIEEPLVSYRMGGLTTYTGSGYVAYWLARIEKGCILPQQFLADAQYVSSHLPQGYMEKYTEELEARCRHAQNRKLLWGGEKYSERKRGFDALNGREKGMGKLGLLNRILLLPPPLRNPVLDLAARIAFALKRWRHGAGA